MLMTLQEFESFTPKRRTFALFGWPLGHTMSPDLHARLFRVSKVQADYIAVAVPPEQLAHALSLARQKLSGINLTIPHKKAVIPLLDGVHPHAARLQAVNTVVFGRQGAVGYNTDIIGFAQSLLLDEIAPKGKTALLLGYGGAASVMAYHILDAGASLIITGRDLKKAAVLQKQLAALFPHRSISVFDQGHLPQRIQLVLNSTPVGMTPNEGQSPLSSLPAHCEYIFDAIYNPPMTALLRKGEQKKIRARDGLYMLVVQAAAAQELWLGVKFSEENLQAILRSLYAALAVKRLREYYGKQNIALCGFMGSGKTTVGRRLAGRTGLTFVDTDKKIEAEQKKPISQIFSEKSEQYFRDLETDCIQRVAENSGQIISLGGGAVLRAQNVEILRKNCLILYLDTPFGRIVKNLEGSTTRPLLQGEDVIEKMRTLYKARQPIYRRAADFSVRRARLAELLDWLVRMI